MFSYYLLGPPYRKSLDHGSESGLCICANDRQPDRIPFPVYVNIRRAFSSSNPWMPAGLSGGAPIAVGGGLVGDLFSERDRASAMALYTLGPLIGTQINSSLTEFSNPLFNRYYQVPS